MECTLACVFSSMLAVLSHGHTTFLRFRSFVLSFLRFYSYKKVLLVTLYVCDCRVGSGIKMRPTDRRIKVVAQFTVRHVKAAAEERVGKEWSGVRIVE